MSRPIRTKQGLVAGALATTGVLAVAMAVPALAATDGAPATVVRKSVQVLADPSGSVQASRLYTQVQSSGEGDVEFTDTVDGEPRNLNGWGSPASVSGDTATWNFTVSGLDNQRTIADFPSGDLPISVTATARLDGQSIDLADLVGKSGELEVTYVVKNTTGVDQEVSWTGGDGSRQSKTMSIPLPFVGSMETVLPSSYADIEAPGASIGGTGRNSTQLSYTLIMFEPLGALEQTITYKAQVTNASVPDVSFTFLPTAPADNPSTRSAQEQYKGGQETGAELTAGATTIDTNLLKLAAGAGTLNEGLAQLLDGANQLSTGLNDTAVPGAEALADGADQVASGADTAAAAGQQVSGGATQLSDGLSDLQGGVAKLSAGIDQLPDAVKQNPGYQQLQGALAKVQAGIGKPSDTGTTTLLGGLNNIKWGLRYPGGYAATDCDVALSGGTPAKCGAMDAVQFIAGLLEDGATDLNGLKPLFAGLVSGPGGFPGNPAAPCPGAPNIAPPPAGNPASYCEAVSKLYYSLFATAAQAPPLGGAQSQVLAAGSNLIDVTDKVDAQLIPGIGAVQKGLYNSPLSGSPGCDPTAASSSPNSCGIYQVMSLVSAGIDQLVAGIADELAAGVGTASPGCDPTASLACATAALSGGSDQLADGSDQLADGLDTLSGGADQLAAGANDLATGLAPAADGAAQIADGLDQAVPGGTQIEDGANQLSEEGTSQLIQAGLDTTNSFGEKYAVMEALNVRAAEGDGLPNGPAEGQDVSTTGVYSYTLQGVNQEDTTNLLRFVIAALLLGAAVGVGVAFARN